MNDAAANRLFEDMVDREEREDQSRFEQQQNQKYASQFDKDDELELERELEKAHQQEQKVLKLLKLVKFGVRFMMTQNKSIKMILMSC